MPADVLKEVSMDEIPLILEELKKDWPANFLLHQYITIMEHYKKERKQIAQTLYRHGSIDNSVYIMKTSLPPVGQESIFLATTCTDLSEISKVLMENSEKLLSEKLLFEINFSKFTPHVSQALTSKGIQFSMKSNIMMWLPPEDKLDVGLLPEEVCLKSLDKSHIPEIDENWPHRYPGSEHLLAHQLQINFGIGLFRKSDNKLLSSAMSLHSGGIFVLYTHLEHRNKGYAEIIVRNLAQEIRRRQRIPFGTIIVENTPSLNLFTKIGFKEFTRVDFIIGN